MGVEVSTLPPVPRSQDVFKLMGVPKFVILAPPAGIVFPSIENPAGCGVDTRPPKIESKVRTLSAVSVASINLGRATVVAGAPGLTVWLIKSAEALFAAGVRDALMVGHYSGLKQPALVTVTAVDTVRSVPGLATTGPPSAVSPAPSVIIGRVGGKRASPIIVGPEGKRVSPVIIGDGGKMMLKVAAGLDTKVIPFKGPRGGPPGEHDFNREACPI